jgi:hypothetical protein
LKNKRWRAGAASPTDNTLTCTTEGFFLVNFIYNINKSSQVQIRLATFDGGKKNNKALNFFFIIRQRHHHFRWAMDVVGQHLLKLFKAKLGKKIENATRLG